MELSPPITKCARTSTVYFSQAMLAARRSLRSWPPPKAQLQRWPSIASCKTRILGQSNNTEQLCKVEMPKILAEAPTTKRSRFPVALLWLQGAYYLATGGWPLISIETFQAVTGKKTDHLITGREGDH